MDRCALIDQMQSGCISALSRLITLVENRRPGWREVMKQLYPRLQHVPTIGITGYPGAGKSTLTGQLARGLVARGKTVGIIAIDPSSHLTGGAFLGDRIRMSAACGLENIYIRSMSSRGALGGLQPAVRDTIKLLDAFGKDYILIETVGVGQGEIDIARAAQLVLLVCAPGQGDAIQYLKAGVMEMADIYVANKMDVPEAEQMIVNLHGMLGQGGADSDGHPPIVKAVAEQGVGIDELINLIEKRVETGQDRQAWRRRLAMEDVACLVREKIVELADWRWSNEPESVVLMDDLIAGRTDPYSLADEMLDKIMRRVLAKHRL
jgi:LAO/AO transport system kinase